MPKEYSPFTPGVPVPREFFVGRAAELSRMVAGTRKAIELQTIERFYVSGERGIGKSSLCSYAASAAEHALGALAIHVYLGGVDTLEEMVRRILERLVGDSVDKPWYAKIKDFLGNHVKELDIFGLTVDLTLSGDDLARAVSDFVPVLRNLSQKLTPEKRGILLILDDINGLASSDHFANWLKSFVDEVATARERLPLTLVLVGLAERRQQLLSSQPSLNRVFDLIEIGRFSEVETRDFYLRTFGKGNVSADDGALQVLWSYSGGHPVFVHELGDATFRADEDGHINSADAVHGAIEGARVIGAKYIEPQVLDAVRSERYQRILAKIPDSPTEHRFTRADVLARLTDDEAKGLDNFLRRMESLGVIRKDPTRRRGSYEFTTELYALFFWLQSQASGV